MAYTGHGHQIPGSVAGSIKDRPKNPARCGGVSNCPRCTKEAEEYTNIMVGEPTDFPQKAKNAVVGYMALMFAQNRPEEEPPAYEVYVVWFSKTLQNWKAIVGTTLPDGRLFEVTYDGDKKTTYLDAYVKMDNVPIPDRP